MMTTTQADWASIVRMWEARLTIAERRLAIHDAESIPGSDDPIRIALVKNVNDLRSRVEDYRLEAMRQYHRGYPGEGR